MCFSSFCTQNNLLLFNLPVLQFYFQVTNLGLTRVWQGSALFVKVDSGQGSQAELSQRLGSPEWWVWLGTGPSFSCLLTGHWMQAYEYVRWVGVASTVLIGYLLLFVLPRKSSRKWDSKQIWNSLFSILAYLSFQQIIISKFSSARCSFPLNIKA